ncbi:aldo/keto reductase [Paractinoplanes atraurantiacus]|uniref:Predicted oxidoreductase n=1 Tax=Paractinoplanes atraurantiacus TaxID=1036182 RepID=A0A285J010_9ACTN|nr:aldo/keto reductase [Actinoplanes atraurantiacus]SNY53639.1 Predicted oxidoreductase [Actinoplanes atraurantiacus]
MTHASALDSGTFTLGGDLPVRRLGFGTMQLTGPGVWGFPADRAGAVRLLRRAVELGVNFFDTADSYGPDAAEQLLREALHPYPNDLVIATKVGLTRSGPNRWGGDARPAYIRKQIESSLRNLGLEQIPLYQLHRIDPRVPLAEQIGALEELRTEGKIRHIGLSQVGVAEIRAAQRTAPIVSVQNLYNLGDRDSEDVLQYAEAAGMAFIPWYPLATGRLALGGGPLDRIAHRTGAAPAQLALAWLLRRSPVMLPIPGTSSQRHLEENVAAAAVELSDAGYAALSQASRPR